LGDDWVPIVPYYNRNLLRLRMQSYLIQDLRVQV